MLLIKYKKKIYIKMYVIYHYVNYFLQFNIYLKIILIVDLYYTNGYNYS